MHTGSAQSPDSREVQAWAALSIKQDCRVTSLRVARGGSGRGAASGARAAGAVAWQLPQLWPQGPGKSAPSCAAQGPLH